MKYNITRENVKCIGRVFFYKNICWCGLSGSGISFQTAAKEVIIDFVGDNTTQGAVTEGKARVAIYVNGIREVDFMMEEQEKSVIVKIELDTAVTEIRVIKLSECAMTTVGIRSITMDSELIRTADRKRTIEFIGDSITCGFGVDLEDPETEFQTSTEDVTKAYAYKTAMMLEADYSMVSYSGYGVCSGWTPGENPSLNERVPLYYEKVGFSYAKPMGSLELTSMAWDFKLFQPALIVINLGTNDASYCQNIEDRIALYERSYIDFLKMVRLHNPKAKILCTLGLMGETLCAALKRAVTEYKNQTGDEQIIYVPLKEQLQEDGRVSAYHPTAYTHTKTAKILAKEIKEYMGWQ